MDGRVSPARHRGVVVLGDSSRVRLGGLPFRVAGRFGREGPRIAVRLDADDLRADRIRASIPRALLGPLTEVGLRGSFDYHAALDLDLARPDSVALAADVVPHGLAIDPATNRLPLATLAQPFTAAVH